jgi:hypothetical protein
LQLNRLPFMAVREYLHIRRRPIREGTQQAHYDLTYILTDHIKLEWLEVS